MIAAALDYEDQAEEDKQPAIESAEPAPDECIEKKQICFTVKRTKNNNSSDRKVT
jgi:hypothetical protein